MKSKELIETRIKEFKSILLETESYNMYERNLGIIQALEWVLKNEK